MTDRCHRFGNAKYATVNAVAAAASEQEFVSRVWDALEGIGLRCIEFEDVELYKDRIAAYEVDQSISDAANRVLGNDAVAFGTFYTTKDDSVIGD